MWTSRSEGEIKTKRGNYCGRALTGDDDIPDLAGRMANGSCVALKGRAFYALLNNIRQADFSTVTSLLYVLLCIV